MVNPSDRGDLLGAGIATGLAALIVGAVILIGASGLAGPLAISVVCALLLVGALAVKLRPLSR